jgi:hypothetical protein
MVTTSGPRFICHRHCNRHPVTAASECSLAFRTRSVRSPLQEPTVASLLGVPHPLVALTQASELRQEASPAPNMARMAAAKASYSLQFVETSSSSNSRLGAEALGQTAPKGRTGGSEAYAGRPRRELQFISAGCWFQLGPQAGVQ